MCATSLSWMAVFRIIQNKTKAIFSTMSQKRPIEFMISINSCLTCNKWCLHKDGIPFF